MNEQEALLFPLPDVVWFPHTMLPLYVFEPRYRALVADALRKKMPVAVVKYKPGWETQDTRRPDVCFTATFGAISQHEKFSDGRYHILLKGEHRCRILEDTLSPRGYRRAWIEVEDFFDDLSERQEEKFRRMLIARMQRYVTEDMMSLAQDMAYLRVRDLETMLCLIAQHLKLDPEYKQNLLELEGVSDLYYEVLGMYNSLLRPLNMPKLIKPFEFVYDAQN